MSKTETAAQGFNHTDLYRLDGKIPWLRAIPYGVQHILAMFVANLAPILIVAGAAGLDSTTTGSLVQSAMLIAGIGTLVQLFPLAGRIGSGLPIVMGISFTFVTVLCGVAATYGFNAAIGAIMVGYHLESLAIVDAMDPTTGQITFRQAGEPAPSHELTVETCEA